MIEFLEDNQSGYKHRTYENVRLADLTIAFAVVPNSSGEITTIKASDACGKPFIMVNLFTNKARSYRLTDDMMQNIHSINIAGNGMSRFCSYNYTQEQVDKIVYDYLDKFIKTYNLDIKEIRSGGQTGADESGLKAAVKLGINAVCLCPKGWRFRTSTEDISDEKLFKNRFINI